MDLEYTKSIINYYNNTQLDYSILWFRKDTRSVHFGFYDDQARSHADALINLNRVMAKKGSIRDGDVILDAGCGQGGSSIWLAENFKIKVHGITLVPHQVEIAKRSAAKRRLQNVSFYEQDYTRTSFADGSFSLIWACESVCHAQHKADFYREAYRLLKPGGRIICAEYIRRERPLGDAHEKLLKEWLHGWSIKDIDTAAEHRENAGNAGFAHVGIEDITAYTKPSLRHLHSMANKLWRLGKILKKIGFRNEINHGNHFASIKQYEALEEQLWYYGLLSLKKE